MLHQMINFIVPQHESLGNPEDLGFLHNLPSFMPSVCEYMNMI